MVYFEVYEASVQLIDHMQRMELGATLCGEDKCMRVISLR